jgi:hypothetical protein
LIGSYRPISLLPVIGKVLEKLLINRINWHIRKNNTQSSKKFGFTPNKSTEDTISFVIEYAKNHLRLKKYFLIIMLDIKGAFDNAWWPQILLQLKKLECPQNIYNLINSYLNDRQVMIKIGHLFATKEVDKGCPQSSALGPGLWNILFDELLKIEKPEDSDLIGFCDDTGVLIGADNIS